MPTKDEILAEFKRLGVNPPGGESKEDLERTLEETKRNVASRDVEAFVRENAKKLGVPEGVVVSVQHPGSGNGEGQEPSSAG
jgi:hypothetical protein